MNSYFLCATQPTNVGDLIINKMLIEELSKFGKVYVDCYNLPSEFTNALLSNNSNLINVYDKFNISLKRLDIIRCKNLIKKENVSFFTSSPGPIKSVKLTDLRDIALLFIHRVVKSSGVRLFSIGNCCSGIAAIEQNDKFDKYIEHYFLRSFQSVSFMKNAGINASYIPDLAFLYARKANRSRDNQRKKIAFCFRDIAQRNLLLDWCKDTTMKFIKTGYQIVIIHQVQKDSIICKEIYDFINDKNVTLVEDSLWYNTLNFYNDVEIVFSNRLHSLLIGGIYGAIPYAIMSDDIETKKISDVFESSLGDGHNRFMSKINSRVDVDEILASISQLRNEFDAIVEKNSSQCSTIIKELVKKIESSL